MSPHIPAQSSGASCPGPVRAAAAALLALALVPERAAAQTAFLEEIIVSASRKPLPAAEVGSSVTVITDEDLKRRGEPRTAETLRRVPGLSISALGGFGQQTQLRIRGADANHTLVIIDGIEVSDPSAGSEFYFDSLTNDGIERIEVLRGPQSAIYGSDAIGGVVRIETLAPGAPDAPPRFAASAETGSLGTRRASVSGAVSAGRLSLSGGIGAFRTDGVSAADERDGNSEADGHKSRNLRARAEIALTERISFDAAAFVLEGDVEIDGGFPFGDNADRAERRERHFRTSAEWRGEDESTRVRATFARSKRTSDNFGSFPNRTEGRRTKLSLDAGLSLPPLAGGRIGHSASLAFEHEREEQEVSCPPTSFFCGNDGSLETQGYAAEYRIGLAEQLFVSASVRRDRSQDFSASTGRLSAAWLVPGSGTRLHASYGTGVKNPTLAELHGFGSSFVGNPGLRPEKGTGWDIGVGQELLSGRLAFDVTGFRNRIRNAINGFAACDPPSLGCNTAANLPGTTRSEGVELAVHAELLPQLSLRGSWTAMRTREPDGRERIRHPRHAWTVGLDGNFRIAGLPATGSLELHRTGLQRDDDFSSFPAARRALEGFSLLAASLSVEATDRVSLFVRGENLLDERYQEVLGYGAPGLTAFVGIRIASGNP